MKTKFFFIVLLTMLTATEAFPQLTPVRIIQGKINKSFEEPRNLTKIEKDSLFKADSTAFDIFHQKENSSLKKTFEEIGLHDTQYNNLINEAKHSSTGLMLAIRSHSGITKDRHRLRASYSAVKDNYKSKIQIAEEKKREAIQSGKERATAREDKDKEIAAAIKQAEKEYLDAYESYNMGRLIVFPGRNQYITRYHYLQDRSNKLDALNNLFISASPGNGSASIFSELVAAYFGAFKLGLGAMITKTETETLSADDVRKFSDQQLDSALMALTRVNDERFTTQNLIAGGGNAMLNLETPAAHYVNHQRRFLFAFLLFNRLGFSFPKIGTTTSDTKMSNQTGGQATAYYRFLTEEGGMGLALYSNVSASLVAGKEYAHTLGYHNGFGFGTMSVGLELDGRFRFQYDVPYATGNDLELSGEVMAQSNRDFLKPTLKLSIIPFK